MRDEGCTICNSAACPGAPRFKGICPRNTGVTRAETMNMAQRRKEDADLRDAAFAQFLDLRGVEDPCTKCRGLGTRVYGSTSTWRGGMGGASMTGDVCDHCWGSGDESRKWVDLKKLRNEEDSRVAARAATFLSDRCGFGLSVLLPGMEELAKELEAFKRQRRERPSGFEIVTQTLAKAVREMIAATKEDLDRRRDGQSTKR